MSPFRLRLPELLEERRPPLTAYAVAKASNGRISESTLYRLVRSRGQVDLISADLCDALCDVLECEPGDLFERSPAKKKRSRRA